MDLNIIDYTTLRQLKEDVTDELFPELLEIFLSEGDQRVKNIGQAITDGDFSVLRKEIHSFKSESATFGAIKLGELTKQINLLCHQNQKMEALNAAKDIKGQWLLVCQALQNIRCRPIE